jgi:hypothetical protein
MISRLVKCIGPPHLGGQVREGVVHSAVEIGSVPLERLALSPQCGFATSILGHALTAVDEEAKLRTVVVTAERVWG